MKTDWFEGAVRPDTVREQLCRDVPELSEGQLGLVGCRVTRLRSVPPEGSWTATYELDLRDEKTGLVRTFATKGMLSPPDVPMAHPVSLAPFGAEGWSFALPDLRLHLRAEPLDDSLPGLRVITDPEQARVLLERLLGGRDPKASDHVLTGCDATIASHKPGVRATVVCNLEYSGDAGPEDLPSAVVVKVHHDDEGSRAHEAMQALFASALGSGGTVRLARPLAYDPELRLSVQEFLPHRWSLKDLFYMAFDTTDVAVRDQLTDAMRATGAGLAELHRCGSPYGQRVTWADEFAILRAKHDKLAAVMPSLREDTGGALARMQSAAALAPADRLGPAHHSFRPAQVLLNGRVSLIDLDKSCQAEPASDIAALTTKLVHMGVNKVETSGDMTFDGEARLAQLRAAFLDGYRRHAPVSEDRLVLWEAYEYLSLVHSAAKKMNRARVDSCCLMLERHLRTHHL